MRTTSTRRTALGIIAAIVVALGGGVAAAAALNMPNRADPARIEHRGIQQDATAQDNGIELRVSDALFSGTETLLLVEWDVVTDTVTDPRTGAEIVPGDVLAVVPTYHGLEGPFNGALKGVGGRPDSRAIVALPPLVVGEDYDGLVHVTVSSVSVHLASGRFELEGSWDLVVTGPSPEQLDEVLFVQPLDGATVTVGGRPIQVSGVRSASETRITAILPLDLQALTHPTLVVGEDRLAPISFDNAPGQLDASFPPTPRDEAVVLEFGAMAVADGESLNVTVDFGAALEQALGDKDAHGDFEIAPAFVVSGDPDVLLGGDRGEAQGRQSIALTVSGNWHSETADPQFFDENGEQLDRKAVQVGYTKDEEGNVHPGETRVAAFIEDPSALGEVTLVLGSGSVILRDAPPVSLAPAQE